MVPKVFWLLVSHRLSGRILCKNEFLTFNLLMEQFYTSKTSMYCREYFTPIQSVQNPQYLMYYMCTGEFYTTCNLVDLTGVNFPHSILVYHNILIFFFFCITKLTEPCVSDYRSASSWIFCSSL